jgi:Na+-transporting methylmalonyl-CoA/oxaloacetate decarboxylase gamma subunit
MAFLNRTTPPGPGRFLQWKIRLIAIGAVFLLVGMAREMDLLVLVSLVFLCGAFVLRFFEKEPAVDADHEEMEEDEPAGPSPSAGSAAEAERPAD